jgi:hypothetical protein
MDSSTCDGNIGRPSGNSLVRPVFESKVIKDERMKLQATAMKVKSNFFFGAIGHFDMIEAGNAHMNVEFLPAVEITSNPSHSPRNRIKVTALPMRLRKNLPENSSRNITAVG